MGTANPKSAFYWWGGAIFWLVVLGLTIWPTLYAKVDANTRINRVTGRQETINSYGIWTDGETPTFPQGGVLDGMKGLDGKPLIPPKSDAQKAMDKAIMDLALKRSKQ